ncbi:TetR/AcrR family transcriptional regulator [Neoroseomonas soli]|uniref:TetR/AcrR family transcriptional regulator n=1 Tax=Neoroseomonas soli TaxID=1081025 RepID=A0A9X9X1Z3_9PROT|nr:TetR/AcrR family transcriptional regulator [Neoroseomonas soli]MBR0673422.1 TetR/AcrR family transcriptional regulator [Neoroseomonas soli]
MGSPARPRLRRKEARPGELLSAALDTFREKGFAATRMDDIAARAGVSKGTIYLYYPSKEAVFEAMVRANLLPNIERMEAAIADEERSSADRLRLLVTAFGEIAGDARLVAVPKLVLAEAGNFPEMARFYRHEVIGRALSLVSGVLEAGMAHGEFRRLDAALTARLFLAPVIVAALWQTTFVPVEDAPVPPADLLRLHLDLFLRSIAADASGGAP